MGDCGIIVGWAGDGFRLENCAYRIPDAHSGMETVRNKDSEFAAEVMAVETADDAAMLARMNGYAADPDRSWSGWTAKDHITWLTFEPAVPPLPYTVSYDANGGTGAPAAQTEKNGKTLALIGTVPTRKNYRFPGWATTAEATEAAYQPGGSYTDYEDVTLYALWSSSPPASAAMPYAGRLTRTVFSP